MLLYIYMKKISKKKKKETVNISSKYSNSKKIKIIFVILLSKLI